MNAPKSKLERFLADEAGATSIEYALAGTLIAVACIAILVAMGTELNALYVRVCNRITGAFGAPAC